MARDYTHSWSTEVDIVLVELKCLPYLLVVYGGLSANDERMSWVAARWYSGSFQGKALSLLNL